MNTIISSSSEVPAYFFSAALYQKFGIKVTLVTLYAIAIVGSITYMTVDTEEDIFIAVMVSFTKFGISGAFSIAYLGNAVLFPAIFMATTFGFCNLVARIIASLSPMVAEV